MKYFYDPSEKEVFCADNNAEECLRTIRLLALDYDGRNSADELKELIDEFSTIADTALDYLFMHRIFVEDTEDEDHESYVTAFNLKEFHQKEDN